MNLFSVFFGTTKHTHTLAYKYKFLCAHWAHFVGVKLRCMFEMNLEVLFNKLPLPLPFYRETLSPQSESLLEVAAAMFYRKTS